MVCRSCQKDNPPGFKHCLHCGEIMHLKGRVVEPSSEPRMNPDRTRAKTERRKAIEKIARDNPEMAAKVIQTWLRSE